MNKAELIAAIAAKTGVTKKAAEESVNAFVSTVTEALEKGDKVQLVGFGSFEVRIIYKKYIYEFIERYEKSYLFFVKKTCKK